jgi:Protein of unknown function (DUF1566)
MAALAFAMLALASAQSAHAALVISNDGQEVSDSRTGLVWQRCAAGKSWDGRNCSGSASQVQQRVALVLAQDQAKATGKPWRLPNAKELFSLVAPTPAPMIDSAAFPDTAAAPFWTSTPDVNTPQFVWVVDFAEGAMTEQSGRIPGNFRLVR